MTPEAVVFDIGNVLIEWNPERFFDAEIGADRRRAMFAAIPLHELNDRVDEGENFSKIWQDTAQAYPDWADEIMLWHDRWIELASPAIPHSVRLLRALRGAGVPVFALSNFGVETFEIARRAYPFLEEFDRAFISGHLRLIKPDHGIYQALETAVVTPPSQLLFTDDRADNIATAQARGWQTHLFDGPLGWAHCLVQNGLLTAEQAA